MTLAPRPRKPCARACPEPAVTRGLCARHAAEANATHNREHAAYHTTEYTRARREQLAAYPYCALELHDARCHGPLTMHHLDHNRDNHHPTNRATLCQRHHYRLEHEHNHPERRGTPLAHALDDALTVIRRGAR